MSALSDLRTGPKRELWFAWYSTVAFYSLYTVVFFSTICLGVVFSSLKVAEWVHLITEGHTFTSSEFMQYYFSSSRGCTPSTC